MSAIPRMESVFSSWKEIAAYLGKGVRTVQRWEASLGLPVHRPTGKGIVLAYRSELDSWARGTAQRLQAGTPPEQPVGGSCVRKRSTELRRRSSALRVIAGQKIELLRATAQRSRYLSALLVPTSRT